MRTYIFSLFIIAILIGSSIPPCLAMYGQMASNYGQQSGMMEQDQSYTQTSTTTTATEADVSSGSYGSGVYSGGMGSGNFGAPGMGYGTPAPMGYASQGMGYDAGMGYASQGMGYASQGMGYGAGMGGGYGQQYQQYGMGGQQFSMRIYDHQAIQTADSIMTQRGYSAITPIIQQFYTGYKSLGLQMMSNNKSNSWNTSLGMQYYQTMQSNGLLMQISQHEVYRRAIMVGMGFNCDVWSDPMNTCSHQVFMNLCGTLTQNPLMMRRMFLLIKNGPGIFTNQYSMKESWKQKFQRHYSTTTTTTSTSAASSNMMAGSNNMMATSGGMGRGYPPYY